MKVDTYLFGSVEVDPEKIITFPNGLVAFEGSKRFTLVHEESQEAPQSFTLQSLDEPMLAFQIIDATTFGINYELVLTDAESALLGSPAVEDVVVMQMLFKKEGSSSAITPNLRAPLLINTRTRVGLQKVMEVFHSNVTLSNLANSI
jgi:flagellar assembly factor FliW